MLFFGEDLMKRQPDAILPSVHASAGIAILILSLVRLGWRVANPPPPLPSGSAWWEEAGSRVTHTLFYVLMIGLPLTGLLALPEHVARHPEIAAISLFGVLPVPRIDLSLAIPWGGIHTIASKVGIALLVLHVAAALKHQFWNRDGVLLRMLPPR
jgi:cytochrome b561